MTHIERSGSVDGELALRQWQEYVDVLHAAGWTTVEVPPADDCPDGVFVEDTVVVYGDLAVLSPARAPTSAAARPRRRRGR